MCYKALPEKSEGILMSWLRKNALGLVLGLLPAAAVSAYWMYDARNTGIQWHCAHIIDTQSDHQMLCSNNEERIKPVCTQLADAPSSMTIAFVECSSGKLR